MQPPRRGPDGGFPEVRDSIDHGDLTPARIGLRLPLTALYAGTWLAEAG